VENAIRALVGWVENLIGWLSRIKIPNLGAIGKLVGGGKSAPAPTVRTSSMAGARITPAPRVGVAARQASTSGAGGGIVINIQGGLSTKDDIARTVQQVVGGRVRRTRGTIQPLRVSS
jgi:hypothetical protein